MSTTSVIKKIEAANANAWVTGKEALGVVVEAQRGIVTPKEHAAVAAWRNQIDSQELRIADGTRAIIDRFLDRHEPNRGRVDLETVPVEELRSVFDGIDYWFGTREAGLRSVNYDKLPRAVRRTVEKDTEMTPEEIDHDLVHSFKVRVRGSNAYGVHLEDGSGFSVTIYSPKGRELWSVWGQID